MPDLFTITGNLLAESRAVFDMPHIGQTVRAKEAVSFRAGGKGVNVAHAWNLFGKKATAVIFAAGCNGERCLEFLKRRNTANIAAVEIEGNTRGGLVAVDSRSGRETTFLGADLPVKKSALVMGLEAISTVAKDGDIIAFCGSFPGWRSSYMKPIEKLCRDKNLVLCADTYGAPLVDFARSKACALVKINRAEFERFLFETHTYTVKDADSVRSQKLSVLVKKHANLFRAPVVGITDGARKSVFADANGVFEIPVRRVRELSPTGCGDTMLAALLHALFEKKLPLADAAARANAVASICAASRETAGIGKRQIEKIFP